MLAVCLASSSGGSCLQLCWVVLLLSSIANSSDWKEKHWNCSLFQLVRSAAFSKKGTLSLSAANFPFPRDFQVGFGFRTMASTGTLLSYNLWVWNVFSLECVRCYFWISRICLWPCQFVITTKFYIDSHILRQEIASINISRCCHLACHRMEKFILAISSFIQS